MDPQHRHQKIPMRMVCPECGEPLEVLEEAGGALGAVHLYGCTACPWQVQMHPGSFWRMFGSRAWPRRTHGAPRVAEPAVVLPMPAVKRSDER